MKSVGIFIKKGVPEALDIVRNLIRTTARDRVRFYVGEDAASRLNIKGYSRDQLISRSEVIVVFGGDGTLLSVARLVGNRGIPILGVNLGGLGFITEASKDEINSTIVGYLFSRKCRFEERIVLSADIHRGNRKIARSTALNDVVINKSALARMVDLEIRINGQYVTTFRADGLILSTPTGSTAHSLSAGGPILYPTLKSFVMTPICPHTLANRPIVVPDDFVVEVSIKNGRDVYLTLDGQVGFPLKKSDRIGIRKADFTTKFILLHDRDYFKILTKKLNWGK